MPRELIHNQLAGLAPTGATAAGPDGPGCLLGPPGYHGLLLALVLTKRRPTARTQ